METIIFSTEGEILTTPEQVVVAFSTAYTREEAQQELWRWILPTLLDCFRRQQLDLAEKLAAFYEEAEQLLNAVYFMRLATPINTQSEGGTRHV